MIMATCTNQPETGMSSRHKNILQTNLVEIIDKVENVSNIVQHLQEQNSITRTHADRILSEKTRSDQVRTLIFEVLFLRSDA